MSDAADLRDRVDSVVWYHTIDLGDGIVTDGYCKTFLPLSQLPQLGGRSVLDIGAWDGYYSFLAERSGASRVVALDHYAWGVDFARRNPYWMECHEKGVLPDHSLDTTDFWDPALPGMKGFNIAHEALGSRVEAVVGDISTMDLEPLGRFDVVLFLGVLYHLKEPLTALEQVRRVTEGVAVIETEAVAVPGEDAASLMEFTAGCYRGFDYSNWYTPTIEAVHELCRAAGFAHVATVVGPPEPPPPAPPPPRIRRALDGFKAAARGAPPAPPEPRPAPYHYRALVHAFS